MLRRCFRPRGHDPSATSFGDHPVVTPDSVGPAIICDVGGVLLEDGMRTLLPQWAEASGLTAQDVVSRYRSSGLRDALWTGGISTETFWSRLSQALDFDLGTPAHLDQLMIDACSPLPAIATLQSVHHRLWLATNHRAEWVIPALRRTDLGIGADRIVCSSLTGSCKPMRSFYEHVDSVVGDAAKRPFVYIDDQAANLEPAAELGWRTVLLDSGSSTLMEQILLH